MDYRVTLKIHQDLEQLTEQIRQFVAKKYRMDSTDNGVSLNIKGDLSIDFIEETLTFTLEPVDLAQNITS